jgi:Ca2+-binding EF-hand superfamily protein
MKIELDHKDLTNIFAIFDRDRSGSITLAEMNGVLTEM